MFKKFFEKAFLNTAERDLKDYTQEVSILTSEERGIHLAYSCLTLLHLTEESDIDIEKIVNTREDVYGAELSDLVLQTNRLLKDYNSAGEMQGAAGTKVWNETFRCLIYPELAHYGREIWGYLSEAKQEANEHLDSIEEVFERKGRNDNVLKIKNARKYLDLIPARFI